MPPPMMSSLRNKVRVISADDIAEMERSVADIPEELSGPFFAYVADALGLMERMLAAPRFEDEEWRRTLFRLPHDLTGLGGSFGYPLVTDVAASMCAINRHPDIGRAAALHRRVLAHAKALRAIIDLHMTDPGTAEAASLLAALRGEPSPGSA